MNKISIYVDLDATHDTRFATVAQHFEEWLPKVINEKYRNRLTDQFSQIAEGFPDDEFELKYNERNVETLAHSLPTAVLGIVEGCSRASEKLIITEPEIEQVVIDVNIWPYKLTHEWCLQLENLFLAHVGLFSKVNVISRPPETLTPELIKESYTHVIMYHFKEWLEMHYEALMNGALLIEVEFIVPRRGKGDFAEADIIVDAKGNKHDLFAFTEANLAERINVMFQPMKYFSIVDADSYVNGEY